MSDAISPCPFCGRAPWSSDLHGGAPIYWIECTQCEAAGPINRSNLPHLAIAAWNARPGDAALRARLAAAEAEVERLRAEADAARATERRAIVAYLRTRLGYGPLADTIERGEHRREEEP
jgi:hypothetical protein